MGNRRSLLEEVADLVEGDRNAQYGDPSQDFRRTAEFWNTYLRGLAEKQHIPPADILELSPVDVAWMMILLKTSRSTVSPLKLDHYLDAAGYAACGADIVLRELSPVPEEIPPYDPDATY